MKKLINSIKKILGYDGSCFQRRYELYKKKHNSSTKKLMDNHATDILEILFDVAQKNEILLWVEFGTLLGAYRDKDFISHDYDLDTGMYASDYSLLFEDELIDRGFVKKRSLYQKDTITNDYILTEVTFEYKGLSVDIFFSFKEDDKKRRVYVYGFENEQYAKENKYNVREYQLPIVNVLENLKIKELIVKGPLKPEETLIEIYGINFMTPDPLWNTTKSALNVKVYPISERYANKKGKW